MKTLNLQELRRSRSLSQDDLAYLLGITQRAVSSTESWRNSKLCLGTVRRYVSALGGEVALRFAGAAQLDSSPKSDRVPVVEFREHLRALGSDLEILVSFPDGDSYHLDPTKPTNLRDRMRPWRKPQSEAAE